jgi:hypothetical protein
MAIHPQNNGTSPKSNQDDSMQISSPAPPNMGPPNQQSPEGEQLNNMNGNKEQNSYASANNTGGVVGLSQGPKVVQTAFIHKLYSMLEDKSIQHLISWSNNNESFVMSPSNDFSKVLAQYFKHTNISSFVRQLNMYGFHKVSDVFHTGSPESALWEFKHGNGNFKKGDVMGLREIKRRASRHQLIHRDSFTGQKTGSSQPGTPAEVMPDTDQRLAGLEQAFYDVHARLQRTEENYAAMNSRYQAVTDGLVRCHQWMHNVAGAVQSMSSSESTLYAEITNMQKDIARQLEFVRALDTPTDSIPSSRHLYYPGNAALEPPLSPRGYNYPDSRRSSIQVEPQHVGLRPPVPPIPPQFSSSPRRFGSVGIPHISPGFSRPALPPQPPPTIHPLASMVTPPPPNLARRHTSADIREHSWPANNPNVNGSPYASGQSSVHWQPSSPQQGPQTVGDHEIRHQLAQYEINGPRRQTVTASQPTPPLTSEPTPAGLGVEHVSWALGGSKFPRPNFELHSAPATRRGSMATLHSLLNPAETVEQENEDEGPDGDRKRKRLQ